MTDRTFSNPTAPPPPDLRTVPSLARAGPPPGVPYDRLARTGAHRWWRPITATAALLGLVTVLAMLAVAVLVLLGADGIRTQPPTQPPPLRALVGTAGDLLVAATLIPAVLLAARLGQRRPAGTVSSVAGRLRRRWLCWCVLPAAGATLLQFAVLLLLAPDGAGGSAGGWVGGPTFAVSAAVLLMLVPLQAAGEEYVARGWFVQAVGSWTRSPWPGILTGGAVWTALHVPSTGWGVADLLLFSVVAGWLTVRTGGLEAVIVLHAVSNTAVFVLQAALGLLAEDGTAGDADGTVLAADLSSLPLYAVAVLALHRRLGVSRLTPAAPAPSLQPASWCSAEEDRP